MMTSAPGPATHSTVSTCTTHQASRDARPSTRRRPARGTVTGPDCARYWPGCRAGDRFRASSSTVSRIVRRLCRTWIEIFGQGIHQESVVPADPRCVVLVASHDPDRVKADLRVAADGRLVVGGGIDHQPMMATIRDQVAGQRDHRVARTCGPATSGSRRNWSANPSGCTQLSAGWTWPRPSDHSTTSSARPSPRTCAGPAEGDAWRRCQSTWRLHMGDDRLLRSPGSLQAASTTCNGYQETSMLRSTVPGATPYPHRSLRSPLADPLPGSL